MGYSVGKSRIVRMETGPTQKRKFLGGTVNLRRMIEYENAFILFFTFVQSVTIDYIYIYIYIYATKHTSAHTHPATELMTVSSGFCTDLTSFTTSMSSVSYAGPRVLSRGE